MVGNDTVTCLSNGKWSKAPACWGKCVQYDVGNGSLSQHSSFYKNGSQITVNCSVNAAIIGYKDVTKTKIKCFNGTWHPQPTCHMINCSSPSLNPHENIQDQVFKVNSTYSVKCAVGYKGNVSKYCDGFGHWKSTGECLIVTCGRPPNVPNGYIIGENKNLSFQYNDSISYG